MRKVCQKCQRSVREYEHFETDPKSGTRYLITSCMHCGFNFDIAPVEEQKPDDSKPKRRGWFKSELD